MSDNNKNECNMPHTPAMQENDEQLEYCDLDRVEYDMRQYPNIPTAEQILNRFDRRFEHTMHSRTEHMFVPMAHYQMENRLENMPRYQRERNENQMPYYSTANHFERITPYSMERNENHMPYYHSANHPEPIPRYGEERKFDQMPHYHPDRNLNQYPRYRDERNENYNPYCHAERHLNQSPRYRFEHRKPFYHPERHLGQIPRYRHERNQNQNPHYNPERHLDHIPRYRPERNMDILTHNQMENHLEQRPRYRMQCDEDEMSDVETDDEQENVPGECIAHEMAHQCFERYKNHIAQLPAERNEGVPIQPMGEAIAQNRDFPPNDYHRKVNEMNERRAPIQFNTPAVSEPDVNIARNTTDQLGEYTLTDARRYLNERFDSLFGSPSEYRNTLRIPPLISPMNVPEGLQNEPRIPTHEHQNEKEDEGKVVDLNTGDNTVKEDAEKQ